MQRGKPAGSLVKLRVAFGDVPRAGSVLALSSGRRYWVYFQNGKTLHCRVMAPGDPVPATAVGVVPWVWAGRRKAWAPAPAGRKPLAQQIAEACAA